MQRGRTKLPVWAAVKAAYSAIGRNFGLFLRFAAIPYGLIVMIDLAGKYSGVLLGDLEASSDLRLFSSPTTVSLLVWLFSTLVAIPFVVACYRVLLRGASSIATNKHWPDRRIYSSILLIAVAQGLLADMPLWYFGDRGFSNFDTYMLAILLYFWIILFISTRLLFLYPVICLGKPWGIAARWRETRGNFWRILAALLIALVPWSLVVGILEILIEQAEYSFPGATSIGVIDSLVGAADLLAMSLISSAIAVVAFTVLTDYPAKGLGKAATQGGAAAAQHMPVAGSSAEDF